MHRAEMQLSDLASVGTAVVACSVTRMQAEECGLISS